MSKITKIATTSLLGFTILSSAVLPTLSYEAHASSKKGVCSDIKKLAKTHKGLKDYCSNIKFTKSKITSNKTTTKGTVKTTKIKFKDKSTFTEAVKTVDGKTVTITSTFKKQISSKKVDTYVTKYTAGTKAVITHNNKINEGKKVATVKTTISHENNVKLLKTTKKLGNLTTVTTTENSNNIFYKTITKKTKGSKVASVYDSERRGNITVYSETLTNSKGKKTLIGGTTDHETGYKEKDTTYMSGKNQMEIYEMVEPLGGLKQTIKTTVYPLTELKKKNYVVDTTTYKTGKTSSIVSKTTNYENGNFDMIYQENFRMGSIKYIKTSVKYDRLTGDEIVKETTKYKNGKSKTVSR